MAIYTKFISNGISILPYIAMEDGVRVTKNDLDGPNAGRTLSGLMIRDRIAVKRTIDVTCRDLSGAETAIVFNAISPQSFEVEYIDPEDGALTLNMYCASWSAGVKRVKPGSNKVIWGGASFTLVEM